MGHSLIVILTFLPGIFLRIKWTEPYQIWRNAPIIDTIQVCIKLRIILLRFETGATQKRFESNTQTKMLHFSPPACKI